jgi:excinuclease ABC subunit A
LTSGAVVVSVIDGEEKLYSEKMACVNCGINVPPLEPRSFSFNSAYGACRNCHGLGTVVEVDPAKLIPNPRTDRRRVALLRSGQSRHCIPAKRAACPLRISKAT